MNSQNNTATPQIPMFPSSQMNVPQAIPSIPQAKPKSGCLKKMFILIGSFVASLLVVTIIMIVGVPMILNYVYKDISPINDKDIVPTFVKVDDKNNAFFDLKSISDKITEPDKINDYIVLKSWDDQIISQSINQNRVVFDALDAAVKKPTFQDPLYQDPALPAAFQQGYPNLLDGYQKLARLQVLRSLYDIKQKKNDEGINDLLEVLSIGQLLQQSGDGVTIHMVGTAVKAIGVEGLQTALTELPISQSKGSSLEKQLDSYIFDTAGLKDGLKQEYFYQSYTLEALASGNTKTIYSFIANNGTLEAVSEKYKFGLKDTYLLQLNRTKFLYANFFRQQINYVDTPCTSLHEVTMPSKPTITDPFIPYKENAVGMILFGVGSINYTGLTNMKCTQQVELNVTKLLVALRAYQSDKGSLPATLSQLVPQYISVIPTDPFSGEQLSYSPTKKLIYSVGMNKKDDGGQGVPHDPTSPDYNVPILF